MDVYNYDLVDKDDGIVKKELMVIGYNCQLALTHLLIIVPQLTEKFKL